MGNWGSKSNLYITFLLICLAAGAAIAAYFIYFQDERYSAPPEIAAAAQYTPPESVSTKYTGKISEEERRDLESSPTVSESDTPSDDAAPETTEPPTPPEASILEEPKTGVFTDALKAKSEKQTKPTDEDSNKSPVITAKKEQPATPAPKPKPVKPKPSPKPEPPKPPVNTAAVIPEPQPTKLPEPDPKPMTEASPESILPEMKSTPSAIPVPITGNSDAGGEDSELTAGVAPKPPSPKPSGGAYWAINALSTEDRDKARTAMSNLSGLPYRIYAYRTEVRGKTYWRIRVGFFSNYEEAARIGKQLSTKYKFPKPWIVMPGPEELSKYNQ